MEHILFSEGGKRLLQYAGNINRIATGYFFTEGPVWSKKQSKLFYTNFADNTIYSIVPGQEPRLFRANSGRAVGLCIDPKDQLIAAETATHAVTICHADHSDIIAQRYGGKMLNSPNDVTVRSDGSVLFTDPYSVAMKGPRELDFNGFYLVPLREGRYGSPILLGTMGRPNGIAFSPDESILYVNDTNQNLIYAYVCENGNRVAPMGVFARLDASYGEGAADGMKVDKQGNVYVTGPGGIWVFDASAAPLAIIRFPEVVGNFCFGGQNNDTLFAAATTSVYSLCLNAECC